MAPVRVLLSLAIVTFIAGGCTDVVYRDRERFNPPPDAASGFLGYFTSETKQTTCGNCHVGHQASWKQTDHANAFATLAALPAGVAKAECYSCHTVTEKGNKGTGVIGYDKVQHEAYRDVQCESCHGPGESHVTLPDNNLNVPLANAFLDNAEASCASCHSGIHQPFAEEWKESGHAVVRTSPAGNTSSGCTACHEGKGALTAWGVNVNYSEKSATGTLRPTACAVCHDPHGSPNSSQLRWAIDTPDPEKNLCMKCHIRRSEPAGNSTSPHAPAGAMLLGYAGYRPAGFDYDTTLIYSSHASDRNPRLCAGCHVNRYDWTDATSGTTFHSTGHRFNPIPCIDGSGRPLADNSCAYTATARTWNACTNSGCHANAGSAAAALGNSRGNIKLLVDQIWRDLDGDKAVDAAPVDGGYLATIRQTTPSAFASDNVISAAEGALFNVRLVGEGLDGHADGSFGTHNPFLALSLLRANIKELQQVYGLAAPPAVVESAMNEASAKLERARTTARLTPQRAGQSVPSWQHSGTSGTTGGRE